MTRPKDTKRRHGTGRRSGRCAARAASLGLLSGGLMLAPGHGASAATCEGLSSAALAASIPNTAISSATTVPAGSFAAPNGQTGVTIAAPVCRVVATVSTQPGEQVGIEVWLPLSTWNSRFEGLGSGGFGGSIDYNALSVAANRGFATAYTDTGHLGGATGKIGQVLAWAHNPVSLQDWGHSAIHLIPRAETSDRSRSLILSRPQSGRVEGGASRLPRRGVETWGPSSFDTGLSGPAQDEGIQIETFSAWYDDGQRQGAREGALRIRCEPVLFRRLLDGW